MAAVTLCPYLGTTRSGSLAFDPMKLTAEQKRDSWWGIICCVCNVSSLYVQCVRVYVYVYIYIHICVCDD